MHYNIITNDRIHYIYLQMIELAKQNQKPIHAPCCTHEETKIRSITAPLLFYRNRNPASLNDPLSVLQRVLALFSYLVCNHAKLTYSYNELLYTYTHGAVASLIDCVCHCMGYICIHYGFKRERGN